MNRKLGLLILRALGYAARAVGSGREALEAAQRTHYDLILMDVQMPGMDGFAATRAIAGSLGEARPRIVGVTALTTAGDRDQCIAAGMDDYLAKPLNTQALTNVILRMAGVGPGPEDGQEPAETGDPIDRSRLDSLRPYDADGSMVSEAIAAFARDGRGYLLAMVDAVEAGDREALAAAAHALQGAAANVGARQLVAACREIEGTARAEPPPRVLTAVCVCIHCLDEAVLALQK